MRSIDGVQDDRDYTRRVSNLLSKMKVKDIRFRGRPKYRVKRVDDAIVYPNNLNWSTRLR